MRREYIILAIAWLVTIGMLLLFVPKNKIREAWLIFFFKQLLTWILGLAVVEFGLIEYPVRLFPHANQTSFSFEYFIYPSICVIFCLHYPANKVRIRRFLYYVYYCTAITIVEVFIEKYTDIIKYVNWSWYITWVTLFITFYASRKYYLWYFRIQSK